MSTFESLPGLFFRQAIVDLRGMIRNGPRKFVECGKDFTRGLGGDLVVDYDQIFIDGGELGTGPAPDDGEIVLEALGIDLVEPLPGQRAEK